MKHYLKAIQYTQKILLAIGVGILLILPTITLLSPEITGAYSSALYTVVHITLFFVMIIRPLADLFPTVPYVRPLVILRKGFGVVSASIAVSFILAKIAIDPLAYFGSWFTSAYWSLEGNVLFAHLADTTAIILLITSNVYSKRVLGAWWKRVQKLAYVYFYTSMLFVFLTYGDTLAFFSMIVVTFFVMLAYVVNKMRTQVTTAQV